MTEEAMNALDWENFVIVMTSQALVIPSNVVAVIVRTEFESAVFVDLIAESTSDSDSEVIDDIESDLENYFSHLRSLLALRIDIKVSIVLETESFWTSPRPGRCLYARRRVEAS